jgi:hypothetical protein
MPDIARLDLTIEEILINTEYIKSFCTGKSPFFYTVNLPENLRIVYYSLLLFGMFILKKGITVFWVTFMYILKSFFTPCNSSTNLFCYENLNVYRFNLFLSAIYHREIK